MRKRIAAALAAVLAVTNMTFPSFAESQLPALPAPSWVSWENPDGIHATWEAIEACEGEYRFEFFKDGERMPYISMRSNAKAQFAMYSRIKESGVYTFHVKAIGDHLENTDSEWSDMSEEFVYKKPDLSFGAAQNLRWSPEEGIIEWDAPEDIPSEYENSFRYLVDLYRNGDHLFGHFSPDGETCITGDDFAAYRRDMMKDGQYTFSVQLISKDVEHIAHGPVVMSEMYLNAAELAREVNVKLQDIQIDLEKAGKDVESGTADLGDIEHMLNNLLGEMEQEEMAIAIQADENVLKTIHDLEDTYTDITKKDVKKQVSEGLGLEEEDIEVVGAGMNIASTSNAIRINFRKPDKEAETDKQLYKNTVQFDISLSDSLDTLRMPVTITMPIPEGIKASRLRLLHYDANGSYTNVPITYIDGDKVRFTVTHFSIFAFVELKDGTDSTPGDDNGNDNTDKDNNGGGNTGGSENSSSGSGGNRRYGGGKSSTSSTNTIGGFTDESWVKDEIGWKCKNSDNTWLTSTWYQLPYMGTLHWYYFNDQGYMVSGWFEYQGKKYYLNPVSDGSQGKMYTGWQFIDGKWYYFNEVSDGTKGALMTNTQIGEYYVDENGIWIE